ncbi:MAG: prepilin-type N-terminal cleavage/methylation domain-containing protein [Candidatus Peregrinibacteria bacterium]|nr:prepilin-type N-terminal cleavage/methylation domain-containing protein [Candidatus Peregrinibacteria bacterium]MDZ4244292.1 prepilin-type N-terminal cleavage/methylation domain-containing protein [Candidatus Gracilibacteria bacterium]
MKKILKGFSLIELLIVITIIGILAVVFLPKITSGPARARDAQRVSDVADIANAIEMYNQDNETYPGDGSWQALAPNALGIDTYFDKGTIPQDPQTGNVVSGTPGPITGSYAYRKYSDGFIVVADTETDKFTDGYMTDGVFIATPSFVGATTETGEDNVYGYWK